MRGAPNTLRAAASVFAALGTLAALAVPAAGADSPAELRARAAELQNANAALAASSSNALLSLYSLDSRLARARGDLVAVREQARAVGVEHAQARRRLAIARRALSITERDLARRLRALYEQGDIDPLAILLGARSLDEALTGLENVDRSASLDRRVIAQVRRARGGLVSLTQSLAARAKRLAELEHAAAAQAESLARLRSERGAYLARLVAQRTGNTAQIASLRERAAAAAARSQELAAVRIVLPSPLASAPSPQTGAPPLPVVGTQQAMTVVATGYSLKGRTATGLPTAYGVVAVDPSVIPLGSRLTIPGYGDAVAADTGSAVVGPTIDLWFPSDAAARAWGRRTVTITLH